MTAIASSAEIPVKNKWPEDYLFRCSELGKIIPKPKGRGGEKTAIQELYIQQVEGVEKNITSKFFDKGTACEQDALDLLQRTLLRGKFVAKNKKKFKNEYIHGTPDVIHGDYVFDIKNAYDVFTFHNASLSWEYEWQIKAYLWLTGRTKGFIYYCLIDMPDFLLADEERKFFYSGKFISTESLDYLEAVTELRKRYVYGDRQDYKRFKLFSVVLTDIDIETMVSAVDNARIYMCELMEAQLAIEAENKDLIQNFK